MLLSCSFGEGDGKRCVSLDRVSSLMKCYLSCSLGKGEGVCQNKKCSLQSLLRLCQFDLETKVEFARDELPI